MYPDQDEPFQLRYKTRKGLYSAIDGNTGFPGDSHEDFMKSFPSLENGFHMKNMCFQLKMI